MEREVYVDMVHHQHKRMNQTKRKIAALESTYGIPAPHRGETAGKKAAPYASYDRPPALSALAMLTGPVDHYPSQRVSEDIAAIPAMRNQPQQLDSRMNSRVN